MSRDLKEYEAVVRLLGDASEVSQLRPGLTAEIEVLVSSRENVLQAPIQSISTKVGQQFAFVIRGDKATLRKVKIGESNDRMIEILGGLEEGELVAMNPASKFQNEIKDLETELIAEQAKRAAEDAKNPAPSAPVLSPVDAPSSLGEASPLAGVNPGEGRGPGRNREGGGNSSGTAGPVGEASVAEGPRVGRPPSGSDGAPRGGNPLAFFDRMDADGDGKLVSSELLGPVKDQMSTLDKNQDGAISREEFQSGFVGRPRGGAPLNGPPPEQAGGG